MEILSICPSVCLSSLLILFLIHATSPVDLSHATSPTVSNVPHPCLTCPPVNWSPFPVNWSPNEHITDLSFPLGVELCVNLTFFNMGLTLLPPLLNKVKQNCTIGLRGLPFETPGFVETLLMWLWLMSNDDTNHQLNIILTMPIGQLEMKLKL